MGPARPWASTPRPVNRGKGADGPQDDASTATRPPAARGPVARPARRSPSPPRTRSSGLVGLVSPSSPCMPGHTLVCREGIAECAPSVNRVGERVIKLRTALVWSGGAAEPCCAYNSGWWRWRGAWRARTRTPCGSGRPRCRLEAGLPLGHLEMGRGARPRLGSAALPGLSEQSTRAPLVCWWSWC